MKTNGFDSAKSYINSLVGKTLQYCIKSPDLDLYDFGFGELVRTENNNRNKKELCTHILHVICRFKVIWRIGESGVDKYSEDTSSEVVKSKFQNLLGLKVSRVALHGKNDLWIDLEDCWIVIETFEDGEESWRFFSSNTDFPHLVVSDTWFEFVD